MDNETIRALAALNNRFYRENHASFSQSRHMSWPGWERVCASMPLGKRPCCVLDVASGNMRFERFMLEAFPESCFEFTCVDACAELAQDLEHVRFSERDVIEVLLDDLELIDYCNEAFDAAVSFGFMHHVPSRRLRESFVRKLVATVRPGATIALSFWQFMNDEKLAAQALRVTEEYQDGHAYVFEPGDYILGWNNREGAYRYCHHFSSEEIGEMVAQLTDACEVVDRFNADGRNGALNCYLVLQRR